ncbi:C-terminal helicase domain-containing protein [Phormidesmis priestleyi]
MDLDEQFVQCSASFLSPKHSSYSPLFHNKSIIEEHCLRRKGKVTVFVTRHLTALYLLNALGRRFGEHSSIGCTVESSDAGARLKPELQRSKELKRFSQRSYNYTTKQEYNLLICTDADGVGINLQDANTVVNYDLPDGADQLFQRAGRVLRMTSDSQRVVHLYILVPAIVTQKDNTSQVQRSICDKFNRIIRRHDKPKHILGSGVVSLEENSEITFDIDLDVEQLTEEGEFFGGIRGVSADSMIAHITVLEQYQSRIEDLPKCLLSARNYSQSEPRVFVLLEYEDNYYPILFNLSSESIEKQPELELFDLLSCAKTEPTVLIPTAKVEHSANEAAQFWCDRENIPIEQVSKICALYLAPPGSQGIHCLVSSS